jgi:pimeloyl-ACP methyl ester carboxylesterase
MSRIRNKTPLILVHGIRTKGSWQDQLSPLIEHFYKPVHVRYWQYRGIFGFLSVFCEIWVFFILFVVAYVTYLLEFISGLGFGVAIVFACLLSISPHAVKFRRDAALSAYKQAVKDTLNESPHLIAHSFGTHLTARILSHQPNAVFRQVILSASVLPSDFDWHAHINGGRVANVRNDFSRGDWVGHWANFLGRFHSDFGNAGSVGIKKYSKIVHKLKAPHVICDLCLSKEKSAPIHDVDCSNMGHTDAFIGTSHFRRWWLPFLWGFDPAEHSKLLKMCKDWTEANKSHDAVTILSIENLLKVQIWGWCEWKTLWAYMVQVTNDAGFDPECVDFKSLFARFAFRLNQSAMCEDSDKEVIFLQPRYALLQVLGLMQPAKPEGERQISNH